MEVEISIRGTNPFLVEDATNNITRDLRSLHGGSKPFGWEAHEPKFQDTPGGKMAVIQADRRLTYNEAAEDLIHQLKHEAELVVNGTGAVAVDVAICEEPQKLSSGKTIVVRKLVNAWNTDPFSPLVERARQSLAAGGCAVKPGKWEMGSSETGTAGGVLVKEFDLPTIAYGPGTDPQAHAKDEFVETDKVVQAVYGTSLIAHGLIGVPVFGWTSDEI